VKKTILIVAGLAAVGAGLYCGARLLAQAPAQQQTAPANTRVAVVNLHAVLKGYAKTKIYDQEVEAIVAPMRKQAEEMKGKIAEWTKQLQTPGVKDKDGWEAAIRNQKRLLEDLEMEASKKVKKKREEQLVQLYREIEDAVQRYAAPQGFTLVLQYTDPETPAEKYTAENIQRKLAGSAQTGCVVPMYFHPGLDISAAIITNLNAPYQNAGGGGGPTGGGGQR
jgi:Skp family chaperone for outer membrane proteins